MKRILSSLFVLLASAGIASAAPGDTTTVNAHPQTSFLSYGNFDHPVTFPDGSLNYRRINMSFTLGKETCPPGSEYCAQWDYTIRIFVMTPTDTFELGRFITPYAHSSYPNMPLSWKHDYVFDVTDYYPILKDGAVMRIKYEGYSWGFTGSLKFDFVEGQPPRQVVSVHKMWDGSFKFGRTNDPINDHTAPASYGMPATATYAEAVHIISGHGSDGQQTNCAEFCSKWYRFMVDGNNIAQRDIWRNDCGVNWVYPQSGTWVYNRANWCPGDIVFPIVHKVPVASLTNSIFNAGIEFEPYTSPNQTDPPSYTTASTMFFYREFTHDNDAGIEDIVAPSRKDLYFRSNPICSDVKLKVKNYGKDPITSMEVEYGIDGQSMHVHNWVGDIGPLESAIISLPTIAEFKTITGNNNGFTARVKSVNGGMDEESHNDTARSTFAAPPHWEKGVYVVEMKSSGFTQPGNASKWIIRNEAGSIIAQRSSTTPSNNVNGDVVSTDTVSLSNGCYSFEVIAEAGYGFRFLSMFTPGSISIRGIDNFTGYTLPKNNPGNPGLAGDFGSGFIQEFVVKNSEVSVRNWNNNIQLSIAPNPAQSEINVVIDGSVDQSGQVIIYNQIGQMVLDRKAPEKMNKLDVSQLPAGVYTLMYQCSKGSKVEKIVISR